MEKRHRREHAERAPEVDAVDRVEGGRERTPEGEERSTRAAKAPPPEATPRKGGAPGRSGSPSAGRGSRR